MTTETEKKESLSTDMPEIIDLTKTKEVLEENIPMLTIKEINELNEEKELPQVLWSIYVHCEDNIVTTKENEHFSIIKYKGSNRKLYQTLGKPLKDNRTYISTETGEGDVSIGIWVKVWNSIKWVYSDTITRNGKCWVAQNIHKWNLKYVNGWFLPKK